MTLTTSVVGIQQTKSEMSQEYNIAHNFCSQEHKLFHDVSPALKGSITWEEREEIAKDNVFYRTMKKSSRKTYLQNFSHKTFIIERHTRFTLQLHQS